MTLFDHLKTILLTRTNVGAVAPLAAASGISRSEIIAMVVLAILGVIGLGALTRSVTRPQVEPLDRGMIVRRECVRNWLHPALDELARRLSEAELRSPEALARTGEQPGVKYAWYIMTLRLTQANGNVAVISTIHHPYQAATAFSYMLADFLATAAGRPRRDAQIEYSTAEVGVVPDRLLALEPREAFDELQMLECAPSKGSRPNADK
jgi:hypothetical protein